MVGYFRDPPLAPLGHPDPLQTQAQKKAARSHPRGQKEEIFPPAKLPAHSHVSTPHPWAPRPPLTSRSCTYSSNKGPGGAKPKTPANTPKNPCAPPFPRSDVARSNAGRRRAILIDAIDRWRKETSHRGDPLSMPPKTEPALPRWSPPPIVAPFPRASCSVHSPRAAPKIRPVVNHPSQMSAAATQICRWTWQVPRLAPSQSPRGGIRTVLSSH